MRKKKKFGLIIGLGVILWAFWKLITGKRIGPYLER
jgi:hypothetical protein